MGDARGSGLTASPRQRSPSTQSPSSARPQPAGQPRKRFLSISPSYQPWFSFWPAGLLVTTTRDEGLRESTRRPDRQTRDTAREREFMKPETQLQTQNRNVKGTECSS